MKSIKIVSIVGTRPQFIKAAAISKELKKYGITEIMIHSGQHYDANMSNDFFIELPLPRPHHILDISSNLSSINMFANIIIKLEPILLSEKPNYVLVYGDCSTTLAGALTANKLNIPVIHVEAGVRSFDKNMPEEINRLLVDEISTIKFCPTQDSLDNLIHENKSNGSYVVGDPMVDLLRSIYFRIEDIIPTTLHKYQLVKEQYYVLTLHRVANTQDANQLLVLLQKLESLDFSIIFPIHPRTKKLLDQLTIDLDFKKIKLIDPIGYLEMMALVSNCKMILTDSGGLQKEAYQLNRLCVTLRTTTEWKETLSDGWNNLIDPDSDTLIEQINNIPIPHQKPIPLFKENSGKTIANLIIDLN